MKHGIKTGNIYTNKNMANKTTIKSVVEYILKSNPSARDNDYLLTLSVWRALEIEPLTETGFTTLHGMITGRIPALETISRWRRRLQQMNPDLRGVQYEKRHAHIKNRLDELGYNITNYVS